MSNWNSKLSNKTAQILTQNQSKFFDESYIDGPWFTNSNGSYVTIKELANPNYDPYIKFTAYRDHDSTYLYHLASERFFFIERPTGEVWPLSRIDIPDWLINQIFSRVPTIYKKCKIPDYNKWVAPFIRKSFAPLSAQNLISVQPMTVPKYLSKFNVS